jgi:hypothetical protein
VNGANQINLAQGAFRCRPYRAIPPISADSTSADQLLRVPAI